jgi:hypothetical protein
MTDLRVGDAVFGPQRRDGRGPAAAIGAAFLDRGGNAWALVPKLFYEECEGRIFTDAERTTPASAGALHGAHLRAPSGGFVCVQVPPTIALYPHTTSPLARVPAVLEPVSIGPISGHVAGTASDFALLHAGTEPQVVLVSYATVGKNHPMVGALCCIDGHSIGVTVGVSPARLLAAVVPWSGLFERFAALGLSLADGPDLRYRNNSIGSFHGSDLHVRARELAEWLEDLLGYSAPRATPMARLVTAIEQLRTLESFDTPLPRLPQSFGQAHASSWNELIELAAIRELAIGPQGQLVSSFHEASGDTVTAAELFAAVLASRQDEPQEAFE